LGKTADVTDVGPPLGQAIVPASGPFAAAPLLCRTCFSLSAGFGPAFSAAKLEKHFPQRFGEPCSPLGFWGSQSWLQAGFPARLLYRDQFLGLRSTMPSKHEAGENTCQVPEWPVQCRRRPGKAACRHDCLPHRAAGCKPRMAKAERRALLAWTDSSRTGHAFSPTASLCSVALDRYKLPSDPSAQSVHNNLGGLCQ
jgi:hypothetical protein